MKNDLPTAVCSQGEDRTCVSWYLSCCERCFTTAFSLEKLLSLKLQFKYPSLQGAEISKQMSPSMKRHPHVVLLAAWRRWFCSYLNIIKWGHYQTKDMGFEPVSWAHSRPNSGKANIFWPAGPAAGFEHRVLVLWTNLYILEKEGLQYLSDMAWGHTAQTLRDRQIPAGFKGQGRHCSANPNIQDEKLGKYPKLCAVPATQTKGYRQLQHTCTRFCDGTDLLSL